MYLQPILNVLSHGLENKICRRTKYAPVVLALANVHHIFDTNFKFKNKTLYKL